MILSSAEIFLSDFASAENETNDANKVLNNKSKLRVIFFIESPFLKQIYLKKEKNWLLAI
jgi:hypothetical protein